MRPAALMELRLGAEGPTQLAVGFSVIALVREHGPDLGHDGEGGQEQALEQHRIVDVGRRGRAGYRHAITGHCDMVLGPALAAVGGVGAGQVAAALGPHR